MGPGRREKLVEGLAAGGRTAQATLQLRAGTHIRTLQVPTMHSDTDNKNIQTNFKKLIFFTHVSIS